ncbi:MAG TPA: metallopeptidase family protein [Nocardioidaceae bacterium]|jgi:predicted Zn-dependent protease with MMP-like domain
MFDVGRAEFEELVADALDELPPDLARLMDNVAIFVEDEAPHGENLLGLYEGIPLTERTTSYAGAVMPDRVTIFRRNILRICSSAADVRHEVKVTVAHEIGHHFGIDDQRLHDLGYA